MSSIVKFFTGLMGLVVIGLLGITYGGIPHGSAKEAVAKLTFSAEGALKDLGADWAIVEMAGQKAVLSGSAPNAEALAQAKDAVRHARGPGGLVAGGVTYVEVADLLVAEKEARARAIPFTWSADWTGEGPVLLSGYVPDMAMRDALMEEARGLYPQGARDKMLIADGAPEAWGKAAMAKLRALVELDRGRVSARDAVFDLYGETDLATEYSAARSRLADFPDGFVSGFHVPEVASAEGAARASDTAIAPEPNLAPIGQTPRKVEGAEGKKEAEAAPEEKNDTLQTGAPERAIRPVSTTERNKEEAAAGKAMSGPEKLCQRQFDGAMAGSKINFASAKAVIGRESQPLLDKLAMIAKACDGSFVEIVGHTDSYGDAERNQRLSELRAEAVFDYFVQTGVSPTRMKAIGFGERQPIANNATREGRAQNRRIEFRVSAQ